MFWKEEMQVPTTGMSALLARETPEGAKSHSMAIASTQDEWLKMPSCTAHPGEGNPSRNSLHFTAID